jgi:dipicolinate synthase subunit A
VEKTYSVIGGDMRSAYAAAILIERKRKVMTAGLELSGIIEPTYINTVFDAARHADVLILPLPLLDREGNVKCPLSGKKLCLISILSQLKGGALVFAGIVPADVRAYAAVHGIKLFDYYEREDFLVMNALPTAEGAAQLLMERLPITVSGARVAVLGYGKCGEAVSALLQAMGARVSVFARSAAARARAECRGMRAGDILFLSQVPSAFDALVNTIPARVVTKSELDALAGCLIIDIASSPGGVDFRYAEKRGITALLAPSLPGAAAPKTAGKYICDTVENICEEEGLWKE